jgi:hypothetical protein
MQITFKLYAGLNGYLPEGADKHAIKIDVPADVTACDLIDRFRVPREMAHLVLLNGVYLPPEERDQPGRIRDGDTLAIWPPVAGG